ncbi:hypothetical protein NE865_15292 [Phthorimaea operculella]|nr:hypothetical protein NE865_15292 [Phthorimaea operculella]
MSVFYMIVKSVPKFARIGKAVWLIWTLPPDGNTTFSVVYLGRREGPVSAHLYIHTALGVHKYSVSAKGVASEYDVWPLLGLRVPANATLQPVLTLRNPTDRPIQVTEVYSSGGWVRLSLPGGEASADKGAWLIPPHCTRPLVRLSISAPPHTHTPTAYVRIKANITGGGIIVGVEARGAPAGEYTAPLQLRLSARGHRDPARTFPISPDTNTNTHNGVKSEGVSVSLVRQHVEPYQELMHSAELTLDYEKLWAGYLSSNAETENGGASNGAGEGEGEGGGAGVEGGAYCTGTVRLGRAALPYSLRLLPGTLALEPNEIEFITADAEQASKEVELKATNEFLVPIHVTHLEIPEEVADLFHVAGWQPRVIDPGVKDILVKMKLKTDDPTLSLDVKLVVHTNVTDYIVPLSVYSGKLQLEWDWPNSSDGNLFVGAVGTSSTRRVSLTVRNPSARSVCVTCARAQLPGASLSLKPTNTQRCIEAGGSISGVLTVVAPARPGPLVGSVAICTGHATTTATVSLHAHVGRITAATLHLRDQAPYSWSSAPIIIESTMQLAMRVLGLWPPPPRDLPSSLVYHPPEGEAAYINKGRNTAGVVEYRPERLCEPNCYTGLDPNSSEGAEWLANSALWATEKAEALKKDMALLAKRQQLYQPTTNNISLYLRTDQVVQIPVSGWVRQRWPRLVPSGAAWAGLAGVGGVASVRVSVRNPSHSHAMLLQPVLAGQPHTLPNVIWEGAESPVCARESCVNSVDSFSLDEWRCVRGSALEQDGTSGEGAACKRDRDRERERTTEIDEEADRRAVHVLPMLKLEPAAEVELKISFRPKEPSAITAFLYLRNNLTIIEGLQLAGRGAYPSFELGGRRPGAVAPLVFEVSECSPSGSGGMVRRTLSARNTGLVPIRLREWRIAGALCANRGFALQPCQPLTLQPNQSAPISLSFNPDYTLARATATLELTTPRATLIFQLQALTPPRILAKCIPLSPRPPWEPPLRVAGVLISFAVLVLVLAAAALDAERLLRRARAARVAAEPRAPLDLRAVAATPVAAPPPAPPRPPPPRRRKTRKVDPQAESRAFERWRAALRRQDDDESRSSEDAEQETTTHKDKETDETPLVESTYEPEQTTPISAYEPIIHEEITRSSSGDDEAHSSGSESSKSEIYEAPRESTNTTPTEHDTTEPSEESRPVVFVSPNETKANRRRESDTRRSERRTDEQRTRTSGKHHLRKDKPSKRRERAPPAPVRASPPQPEHKCPSGCPPVRWGASWSSVLIAPTRRGVDTGVTQESSDPTSYDRTRSRTRRTLVATNKLVIEPSERRDSDISKSKRIQRIGSTLGCAPAVSCQPDCRWLKVSVLEPKTGHITTLSDSIIKLPGAIERRVRSCTLLPDARRSINAHLLETSKRLSVRDSLFMSQVITTCGFQMGGLGGMWDLAADSFAIPFSTRCTKA